MNKKTKTIIIGGLIGGIAYASIMAGFDYSDGQDFRVWRFLLNAIIFGTFMAIMNIYNIKKQTEENKNNE
ncbi:hypothetical protein [Winogradskyella sp. SYSU M77433]|jgi:hypothetical protein|uniref:hypothetical protein n=1 Tax=Winogradskyella sp. SYSU M77433 TaxID=3042722 RepID=UPI002480CD0E|nr:hypothetical protein [Winogradskyella sp. SYSU M77433]MDH7914262.1 hypothetical protein [Winogradskyella sp. SYSU M77433]